LADDRLKDTIGPLGLADIQALVEAAKLVGDLNSLDPNNRNISILRENIIDRLKAYFEPTINWFAANKRFARLKINEIDRSLGLYDRILESIRICN
jgi:hypothetical protein